MDSNVSTAIAQLNEAAKNGKEGQEQAVLAAARQIVDNLENPVEKMLGFVFQPLFMAALEMAVTMGLLDAISVEEGQTTSLKQIQAKVKGEEQLIKRTLQTLCACGMLKQPKTNEFQHTGATKLYMTMRPVHAMVLEMIDIFGPAASLPKYMAQKSYQVPSSEAEPSAYRAFRKAAEDNFYTLKRDKSTLQSFNDAMLITKLVAFDVSKFPWPEHVAGPNSRDEIAMLDIGGGLGQLLETVIEAFPDWYAVKEKKLMVQDRSDVLDLLKGKETAFQLLPKSYLDEATTISSAYVYRWVFMDQPDERASRLLQALKPAFIKGAKNNAKANMPQKLFLIENCRPSDTAATPLSSGDAALDMIMMILSNSKCRTEEEIRDLLAQNGFKLLKAYREESGKVEKANGRGGKVLFEAVLADS